MDQKDKRELFQAIGAASSIGITFAASVIAGLLLGRWVDQWLGTSPWITIVGIILGIVTGIWSIYSQVTGRK